MDIEEVSRRYGVSCAFLKEYKSWKLVGDQNEKTPLQFDDRDMANICLVVTLRDIGFSISDVQKYMEFEQRGDLSGQKRLAMLECLRQQAMKAIHEDQLRLDKLDYLRYSMRRLKEGDK